MKKLFWLISGVAAGLAIAKQIETNPKAKAVAEDLKRAAVEFGTAFVEGYSERDGELAAETTEESAVKPAAKKAPAKKPAAKKPAAKKPASAQ
jgi:hypothetical protein